jgi:hypothetical protein
MVKTRWAALRSACVGGLAAFVASRCCCGGCLGPPDRTAQACGAAVSLFLAFFGRAGEWHSTALWCNRVAPFFSFPKHVCDRDEWCCGRTLCMLPPASPCATFSHRLSSLLVGKPFPHTSSNTSSRACRVLRHIPGLRLLGHWNDAAVSLFLVGVHPLSHSCTPVMCPWAKGRSTACQASRSSGTCVATASASSIIKVSGMSFGAASELI